MKRCDCCKVVLLDSEIEEYDSKPDENGDIHHQGLCNDCASRLHWKITELASFGFYVESRRTHHCVSFAESSESRGQCAGTWTATNVHRYPMIVESLVRRGGEAATPSHPTADDDEQVNRARLMAFFFGREANVRADGTLAVSPSGREWF
jgi:hypothetical protein